MVRDEIRHVRKIRLLEGKGREGERPRHVLADRAEHALELLERLMLVFVDRLLLRISAKMDHLPQRIQHRQMLLPVMVERLEEDALLALDVGLDRKRTRLNSSH